MKWFRFFIAMILTVLITVILNSSFGNFPPLGRFCAPFEGFWQNAGNVKRHHALKIDEISGLHAAAKVKYDERWVPHIFAKNDHDLYFIQGYITAKQRLWQMDFLYRAAAGRLSEVVGLAALTHDRKMRRIGMKLGALNAYAKMLQHDSTRGVLQAYCQGVNAYIDQLSYSEMPLEFKLLDYKPEKWTPLKTGFILMNMSLDLTGSDKDLEFTNALKKLNRKMFDRLYPRFPEKLQPVVPKTYKPEDFPPLLKDTTSPALQNFLKYKPGLKAGNQHNSNNWAVSKSKTTGSGPILCNDPHLTLQLPSIWYENQLVGPEMNVYGVSIPGTPCVVIGFNQNISWGVTNANWDVVDWYKLKFKSSKKDKYLYGLEWRQTSPKIEKIRIRGKKPYFDTVIYTHLGPVPYDESFGLVKPKINMAMRWIAHDSSNELLTFYLLNKAKDYRDFKTALTSYDCPAQNFVFASRNGNIAIWSNGKFPKKAFEQGRFLLDGTNPESSWHGFIERENLPHILNPSRQFVSSANQHPTDSTYSYYYNGLFQNYRARRINDRLLEIDHVTIKDMKQLQNDNYNLKASESLNFMLKNLDTGRLDKNEMQVYELLGNWDYYNDSDQIAPVYYEQWWDNLYQMAWSKLINSPAPMALPEPYIMVNLMKSLPGLSFFDLQNTREKENIEDLIRLSFHKAVDSVQAWHDRNDLKPYWWRYKKTRIQHLTTIKPFGSGVIPTGGDGESVNAITNDHGPSWRMIVSFGREIEAFGIYPGGQSGNPGSPHYDNMIGDWARGDYDSLLYLNNDSSKDPRLILEQRPVPEQE